MKTISWAFIIIIMGWKCTSTEGKTIPKPAIKEDSLDYYPPTPAKINQQEFRRYYREVANYFESTLVRRGFNGGILVAKEGLLRYAHKRANDGQHNDAYRIIRQDLYRDGYIKVGPGTSIVTQ